MAYYNPLSLGELYPVLPGTYAKMHLEVFSQSVRVMPLDIELSQLMSERTTPEDLPFLEAVFRERQIVPSRFPGSQEDLENRDPPMDPLRELCRVYQRSYRARSIPVDGKEAFVACANYVKELRNDQSVIERVDDMTVVRRLGIIHDLAEAILQSTEDVGWCAFFGGFLRGRKYTKDIDVMTFSQGGRLVTVTDLHGKAHDRYPERRRIHDVIGHATKQYCQSNLDFIELKAEMEALLASRPDLYPVKQSRYGGTRCPARFDVELLRHPFYQDLIGTDLLHHGALVFIRGERLSSHEHGPMRVFFDNWFDGVKPGLYGPVRPQDFHPQHRSFYL